VFSRRGNSRYNRGEQGASQFQEGQPSNVHLQHNPNGALDDPQAAASLNPAQYPPPPVPDTTTIGKNFNLEGDNIVIRNKGALAINGTVSADIHCEHLTVGDQAHITVEVAADEIHIHGRVEGTIKGSQVTLHETASVEADINSQFLSIERGAIFDGCSRRVTDASEVAPQLMSGANDSSEPLALTNARRGQEAASYPQRETGPQPYTPTTLEPSEPSVETSLDDDNSSLFDNQNYKR